MNKLRTFLLKLRVKMTPGWELLWTVLFGWTGVRYFVRGKYFLGLRMFLTLGIFGIGWMFDIITCLMQYRKWCDIKDGKLGYTVEDSSYPNFKRNECYWHDDAYARVSDIGEFEIKEPILRVNNVDDLLKNTLVTGEEDKSYRQRIYFCKDKVVCTNVDGIDYEYKYNQVKNMDFYVDGVVIRGNDNVVHVTHFNNPMSTVYDTVSGLINMEDKEPSKKLYI